MMNFTLLKQSIKAQLKLLLIFCAILTMYITVIIAMFDPSSANALLEFSKAMPELMAMFKMDALETTLIGFVSSYLYGFLMIVVPMVYIIIVSNKLVASYVDKGSMAYLLASPNSRFKVIFTQLKALSTGIFIIIFYCTVLGIITCEIMFKGDLDIGKFIYLNVGVYILQLAIGSICFFASCISNETKTSLLIGAGIPLVSFLIQMLVNIGDKFEFLKYITFMSLYDTGKILAYKTSAIYMLVALFVGAIILYVIGMYLFTKRDLPL